MAQLVTETLATLRNTPASGILNDETDRAIGLAADLLAKARCPQYHSGFPEIDATEVTAAEGRALEQALLELLQQNRESGAVCALMWALGKSDDPAYVEEFATHLERGVRMLIEGNRLVFQALCYLDKIGMGVFERDGRGSSSQSLAEVEKNLRQARAYLAKQGIQVPC